MKKLVLLFAAVTLALSGSAKTISPEQALERVAAPRTGMLRAGAKGQVKMELVKTGEFQGMTTYYVFSNSSRSMILSADDAVPAVIGILDAPVTAGTPMPDQLKWWLSEYGRELKYVTEHYGKNLGSVISPAKIGSLKIMAPGTGKVNDRRTADRAAIQPLLKTTWNQMEPYNAQAPGNCPTGCVATAMAQVMKYHAYPDKGRGRASASYNNGTLSMDLSTVTLKWDQMLDNYPNATSGTADNRDAVASLMKVCGYSVGMSYAKSASGAPSNALVNGLVNRFSYDQSCYYDKREFYSTETWIDMLYNELANGRPVLYGGRDSEAGHQFVCDGYNTSGNFHFNWGWGGAYDGYFSVNSLVPSGQGTGGNEGGFNYSQDAVFNVMKPQSGSKPAEAWLSTYSSNVAGGQIVATASNRTVTLTVAGGVVIYNGSGTDFVGKVGYTLQDAAGNVSAYEMFSNINLAPSYFSTSSYQATLPASVKDGVYVFTPVYQITGTNDWRRIRQPYTADQKITVTLANGTITKCEQSEPNEDPENPEYGEGGGTPAEVLTFSDAKTTTGFNAGEDYNFTVTIANSGKEAVSYTLFAPVLDTEGYIVCEYQEQEVSLAAGEAKTYTFTGTIDSDVEAGNYYLAIADTDYNIHNLWKITVESSYVAPAIEVTELTPTTADAGKTTAFTATVANNSTSLVSGNITPKLGYVEDNSFYTVAAANALSVRIFPSRTVTKTFDLAIPVALDNTKEYYMAFWDESANCVGLFHMTVNGIEGVDDLTADRDDNAPVEYYNLQGQKIAAPTAPGLYLRRQGNTTAKTVIK